MLHIQIPYTVRTLCFMKMIDYRNLMIIIKSVLFQSLSQCTSTFLFDAINSNITLFSKT